MKNSSDPYGVHLETKWGWWSIEDLEKGAKLHRDRIFVYIVHSTIGTQQILVE